MNSKTTLFPFAVLIDGTWYQATFFYESLWDFLVFLVLHRLLGREHEDGDIVLWYFALYGFGRMLIESLRQDSLMLGSLRVSQWLSAALVIFSVCALLIRKRRKSK